MNEDCACEGKGRRKGRKFGCEVQQKSKSREFKSMFESSFFQSGSKFPARKHWSRCSKQVRK